MARVSGAWSRIALGFVIYPLIEGSDDVINSDWPAFATGGRLIVEDPGHLYDLDTQRRVQLEVTDGRTLVTLGINGILPFLAPAWVAFLAVPVRAARHQPGRPALDPGRARLPRARPLPGGAPAAARRSILPAFASVPTALLLLNAQLDGFVALGIGAALALWTQPFLAGLCLGLTLLKPQLVLPLGAALAAGRAAGACWPAGRSPGVVLLAASAALNPRWVLEWLPALGGTVQPGQPRGRPRAPGHAAAGRLPGLGGRGPDCSWHWPRSCGLAGAAGPTSAPRPPCIVAGGVLVAPHALPTDLVLVAVALAIWGEARWPDSNT